MSSWSSDLFTYWDVSPPGTFFRLNFPFKVTGYLEGNCIEGEWTITKIVNIWMVGFRKDDPALVIPRIGSHIEAIVTSPTCQYTYHLTRQGVRDIIEWAQREGVQSTARGRRQIEAALVLIESGSK